jgi:hypothetical protein
LFVTFKRYRRGIGFMSGVCRLEIQLFNVRFHQVWKQQVREHRQIPRMRLLFVDDEMNDVA